MFILELARCFHQYYALLVLDSKSWTTALRCTALWDGDMVKGIFWYSRMFLSCNKGHQSMIRISKIKIDKQKKGSTQFNIFETPGYGISRPVVFIQ